MYVSDDYFNKWMEKLYGTMRELSKDLKSFVNTNDVFDRDDKLLDNQDLCQTLNVSKRTLQRYRSDGMLPYLKYGQKIHYRTADVREFVKTHCDHWQNKAFENKFDESKCE
jgi:transcriptional antiterminator